MTLKTRFTTVCHFKIDYKALKERFELDDEANLLFQELLSEYLKEEQKNLRKVVLILQHRVLKSP